MTDQEFGELMVLLDSLWGGVDQTAEAGYRLLLADRPYELVHTIVMQMAAGEHRPLSELKWLPKPPELFRPVRVAQDIQDRMDRARRRLELEQTNPYPGGTIHALHGADLPPAG